MISLDIGVWVAALFTIAVLSFLYKDNKLFRFAEYTVVGTAAAHTFIMNVNSVINIGLVPLLQGQYIYILAFIAGLTLYARYWEKYTWLMRYGIAVIVGVSTSLAIRGMVKVSVISQIAGSMLPIVVSNNPLQSLFNVIIIVFTFCAIIYFVFAKDLMPQIKTIGYITRIGRIALFCAIGYYLGMTVMTRYSFIIDRLQFLLFTWLGL